MKKLLGLIIGVFVFTVIAPFQPIAVAQAGHQPKIEVEVLSNSRFKITISNGYSYGTVNLYSHQSDSELWNGILNIGTTDRNGNFTTTRTFNSFQPNLAWFWYATVDGVSTASISTGGQASTNNHGGKVLSQITYDSGTLVSDRGTVYLIYKDQRIGFSSAEVFLQLGFSWNSVVYGDTSSLPYIYTVTSGVYSHPWGSWVRSGDTIYFVHEDGLIPVTTYEIFKNNGGESHLVVPMNWYDKQLKKLSKMKKNDSRLE